MEVIVRRRTVMAHRGGGAEVPENTWSAVEHVAALGLEWMETDLRVTADGVVVLSHDPTLDRTTTGAGRILARTWREISRLDAGDGRPPVRLDELLAAQPSLFLNVDVKDSQAVQPALQAVRAADALERVRFASFSARRLAVLRRQEPRATTSLGVADVVGLMGLAEAGILVPHTRWGWTQGRVDAVQVPVRRRGVPVATARLVATAHHYGLEVHVWTVDEEPEMRRLVGMGVDCIITDRPTLALEVLQDRPGVRPDDDGGH